MGRAADTTWRSLVARVEWHAGRRGCEYPVLVRVGGKRLEVTVESSKTVGPRVAGLPVRRVFFVRDDSGRRLRIEADASGRTRVEIEADG